MTQTYGRTMGYGWVLLLMLAGCAGQGMMAGAPARFSNGILVSQDDMTLYTFDKDAMGKSACNGACATNWPPLKATASEQAGGQFSIITRDDGSRQWAYAGKPLYLFVKDTQPGDIYGNGIKGVWHVIAGEHPAPTSSGMYRY